MVLILYCNYFRKMFWLIWNYLVQNFYYKLVKETVVDRDLRHARIPAKLGQAKSLLK